MSIASSSVDDRRGVEVLHVRDAFGVEGADLEVVRLTGVQRRLPELPDCGATSPHESAVDGARGVADLLAGVVRDVELDACDTDGSVGLADRDAADEEIEHLRAETLECAFDRKRTGVLVEQQLHQSHGGTSSFRDVWWTDGAG